MRRAVLLLNLALAAAIGLAGWQMYRQFHSTQASQRKYLSRRVTPPVPPILTLPTDAPPVQSAAYYEIAAKLPFSQDRNPTVVVDVVPAKPMPALPGYHGMMNFGQGPRVILSANGTAQRTYQVGETIGDFKLVAVAQSGLVFEWDGKQVPASYAELVQRAAQSAPAAAPAQSAPAAAAAAPAVRSTAAVVSVSGSQEPAGSAAVGSLGGSSDSEGIRDCKAGDTSPEGAIVNGYKKVVTRTPFSTICRWVPAK